MAKKALSLVNVEFKQHNSVLTSGTISDGTGFIQQLTNIAQGDTNLTRDGSSIKIVSIYLKGFVQINSAATQSIVRLMIVLDKQTNQAIYTTADLLHDVTEGDSLVSALNLDNKHRFVVLWDKSFTVDNNNNGIVHFSFFKKCNYPIRYDNSAAAITSLTSNSLSMVRISNEGVDFPDITSFTRIRYVDN